MYLLKTSKLSQEKSCCVFAQFNFNYYICKEKKWFFALYNLYDK
ncbi:hypothetical protein HMPREF0971_00189 [Segatella oris F0302]|uniref:Uncharacterized protein n=1 Tax=Segatella oris F0302 TaxID=649760 RepID=D1QMF6_9BACT|nr:hypothetical protein HMPREF0971_00189 [Segatella oris F0302]